MSDGDRFFDENDPEWAVSQLAAQVAESARTRRRVSWHIVAGSVLTTVLVVGAFVLGLSHDPTAEPTAQPETRQPEAQEPETQQPEPTPVQQPAARRVTLVPKPEPTPTPTPTPPPVISVAPTQAPAPEEPTKPSNQVGPNRPITTPIDPDDR